MLSNLAQEEKLVLILSAYAEFASEFRTQDSFGSFVSAVELPGYGSKKHNAKCKVRLEDEDEDEDLKLQLATTTTNTTPTITLCLHFKLYYLKAI